MPIRKIHLLAAYIVLLHVLVLVVIVKSDFLLRAAGAVGLVRLCPELTAHYRTMLESHSKIDPHVPDGAVLFVGDSHIQGLCVSAVADRAVNYGISGDTTVGVLGRIDEYASIARARAVVLEVGVNDLRRRPNDRIIANYERIISKIPRDVRVVVSAVLPVDERVTDKYTNRRIDQLNAGLKRLCGQRPNCRFVDVAGRLKGATGNLGSEYHTGDGLHLSHSGYRFWIDSLREALETGR